MFRALREHWPEFLLEAIELGIYMVGVGLFTVIFEARGSPVRNAIGDEFLRRALRGCAIGLVAIALVYSPLGKLSGAHMNPAVTLTFLWLRKIRPWDAFFYVVAQFLGGIAGILVAICWLGPALADPAVNYVVTTPGADGARIAFLSEFLIAFVLMLTVLVISNMPKLARWTGVAAGCATAIFIMFEAPFSGMSMNPARTLGPAMAAPCWTGLWIYFVSPVLAMHLAGATYVLSGGRVYCAKFHHHNRSRCIFNCSFDGLLEREIQMRRSRFQTGKF